MIETLTGILLLAVVVEAIVEYFIKPAVKPNPEAATMQPEPAVDWRGMALRWVSALIGVGLCALYRADLLALLGLQCPLPVAGWVLTGLLIGRGSNFVNDFASRFLRRR